MARGIDVHGNGITFSDDTGDGFVVFERRPHGVFTVGLAEILQVVSRGGTVKDMRHVLEFAQRGVADTKSVTVMSG